ncbi:MAG: hypothetical protein ACK5SI_01320 [Planctomycetia bacterium]|jgi:hypothetical protein
MPRQNDAPPADPQTPGSDPAAEKKPCNTLPEVAAERDNDIVERIDVLIDHADIAGPDWIKDVLQTARQSIVDLRATAAAREQAPPR